MEANGLDYSYILVYVAGAVSLLAAVFLSVSFAKIRERVVVAC